jgi:hypothetical protein
MKHVGCHAGESLYPVHEAPFMNQGLSALGLDAGSMPRMQSMMPA